MADDGAVDTQRLSSEDAAAVERLADRGDAMLARTLEWARINTGSWNADGLNELAPQIAAAFGELDAVVEAAPSEPFETVGDDGDVRAIETGPVIRVISRVEAPTKVVMSGHYDTVFPPGTFDKITQLSETRWNGPGLADMKGGLVVALEALRAFEAGPLKSKLAYEFVITPDEEIGNFASADALRNAATSGALVGLTYEPAMETGEMAGGRKGSAVYDVVFRGKAAHAGRAKEDGVSALEAGARLAIALEDLNGVRDGVTFNVGALDGGGPVNIVPDLAIVRFGARAPDSQSADWANARVRELTTEIAARPGLSAHVHGGFYRPPKPRNLAQDKLIRATQDAGRALGLDLKFVDTGGVCEGNNIFAAGVPNIDTLGVRGGRIHSSEEYVEADSFVERARLSAVLLTRIADGSIDAAAIKSLMDQDAA